MSGGPWEDYAPVAAPASPAAGPWQDFVKAAPAAPRTGAAAVPTEADEGIQTPKPAPAPTPAPSSGLTAPNGVPLKLPYQPALGGITAAIQAGMHVVDSIAGSLVGGLAAIPTSAVSIAKQGFNKLTGQPVQPDEIMSPPEVQEKASPQIASGLGSMGGRAVDQPATEGLVDKADNVTQSLPAVAALHGTMGPAGAVDAASQGVQRMGVGSAVRNVTPFVRDSAKVAADDAAAAKLAAPENQGIVDAIDAGYKITPKAGNAGPIAKNAQTAAGSARLEGALSAHNAENTARLAREDIGVAPDEPITTDLTKSVRDEAGQDYAAVANAGPVQLDGQLNADLGRIAEPYVEGGKDFSQLAKNPIIDTINSLREDSSKPVDAASVISIVKDLRNKSDKEFGPNGDKKLGNDYRAAASALDNSLDRSLTQQAEASGDPTLADAVTKYKAARVRIAKTYMLDDAMRGATKPGEVNAVAYRQALGKGVPLSGPGLQIAKFAKQFGGEGLAKSKSKAAGEGPTYHDIVLGVLHGGPVGAAAIFARPATRALLGSDRMQQRMAQGARDRLPPEEPPAAAAPPPEDPTTSPGAGPGAPPAAPPPEGALGDLTPMWSTSQGAGGSEIPRGIEPTGLVPAVGEAHTPFVASGKRAGEQIPAVPGRPDLPDSMLTGRPMESAGTDRANAAMLEPGAQEAMRRAKVAREDAARAEIPVGEATEVPAGTGVGEPKTPKPGSIPVGKTIDGQPEIKGSAPPAKIPAGAATEITPEVIELGRKWQREQGLGDDDAAAAHAVARAFDHDPEATAAAAAKFDNNPAAFDAEIARLNAERTASEDATHQAARGSKGNAGGAGQPAGAAQGTEGTVQQAAQGGPDGGAAAVRPDGVGPGADGAGAAGAGRGGAEPTGGQGQVEIREAPGGFEAYKDGKKVGYLKDNLERGQAKQLDENANVDMVKVDKDQQGTGVGRALYEAFNDKHEGRILPSGKTEPSAWQLWKRNYPDKVDAFVDSEAARIKDGADPSLVLGNITDPEVAQRVQSAANGAQIEPGWRSVADTPTKRVRDSDGGMHTVVKLPDGSIRRITRLGRTESMGLPGWHDMDASDHSYLADTEADAIKALIAKGKK